MQYLKQIVNTINESLKNSLVDQRFGGSLYHGIAILAKSADRLLPLVPDIYDQNTYITPDDSVPLTVYHRTISLQRTPFKDASWGDGMNGKKEQASMAMIVMGTRRMLKMTAEELEAAVVASMPSSVARESATQLKLISCNIEPTTSDLDPVKVYQGEVRSQVYDLEPTSLMIRVNYTITSTYRIACFDIAGCDC